MLILTKRLFAIIVILLLCTCKIGCEKKGGSTSTGACPPAGTPGLELCVSFDGDEGLTAHDESGHGRDGIIMGAATLVPGRVGRAVKLTGAAEDLVDFGDVLPLTERFSIEAWVRLDEASGWDTILNRWTGHTGYWLGGSAWPGGYELWVDDVHADSTEDARLGQWQHVAGTFDRVSGNVVLYIDGCEAARVSHPGPAEVAPVALAIGKGGDSFSVLNGAVDELRVWSTVRTASEICEAAGRTDCGSPADAGEDAGEDTGEPDDGTVEGDGGDDGAADGPVVRRLCPDSQLTFELLDEAHDALAGGAGEVPLSDDGCIRLQLTSSGGETTEELLYDGTVVQRFVHTSTGTSGESDDDQDGFFGRTIEIVRDPADAQSAVVTEFSPDGTVLRRETSEMNGDQVHVVIEVDDGTGTGTLIVEEEFDAPSEQADAVNGPTPGTGPGSCTPEQAEQIKADMENALRRGLTCAQDQGVPGLEQHLEHVVPAQGIELRCGSRPGSCAEIEWWSALPNLLGLGGSIVITVDPNEYFGNEACANHEEIMLHEVLHSLIGLHSGYEDFTQPESRIKDRVYACAGLCALATPTKCQCASCLRTTVCDPRCAGLADCEPDLGAQCHCLANRRWYKTMIECTVGCPSGLTCFASDCRARSYACP